MSILLLESLHPEAEALLAAHDSLVHAADPNAPGGDLAAVRAILTRGRGRIDEALMQRCTSLSVIARVGTGLDNLDTQAAKLRGVTVIFAPGANADTVAEHAFALILDSVRGITRCAVQVAAGRWEERANYAGNEVRGLLLGIVGFGNIGSRTAALAKAFGMRVAVAAHVDRAVPPPYSVLALDELLATADVVSLHLPLTNETRVCIGARELARMKIGAILVNTARGALIDSAALREALSRGRLGGFAADVLDAEPPAAGDPLLCSERVLLTPHVAWASVQARQALADQLVDNLEAFVAGAPRNDVTKAG